MRRWRPGVAGQTRPGSTEVTQPAGVEVEAAAANPERRGLRRGSVLAGGAACEGSRFSAGGSVVRALVEVWR
uniref:Uncharacterized protein n=1 Tax=Zea mays TaxID=4577 RepID=C4J2U7_MAIZE|nr:unknown [Zea mays]